jgi:hypothetical protein
MIPPFHYAAAVGGVSSSFGFVEYFSFARLARRAFCFAILAAFCPFLLRLPLTSSSSFSRNSFRAIPRLSASDLDC